MRSKAFAAFFLPALLVSALAGAQENWPLGPERFVRSSGAPVVQTVRFPAAAGAARLVVVNGESSGGHRVSSAVVKVNGQDSLRPSDLNQNVARVSRDVMLAGDNMLSVELKSAPGGFVTVQIVQEAAFREAEPSWSRADIAVTSFTVTPDRLAPGGEVLLSAVVENVAARGRGSANLVFELDREVVARIPTGELQSLGRVELAGRAILSVPGRHAATARLEILAGTYDRAVENNSRTATIYVSGEPDARPEIVFDAIDFEALQLVGGEPAVIPVTLRNPSFTGSGPVRVFALLDGQLLKLSGGDLDDPSLVVTVAGGESRTIYVPVTLLAAGQHQLQLFLQLPDTFPDAQAQANKVWDFTVNAAAALCTLPARHAWHSLGPRTIHEPGNRLPSGSVGRIDAIAFHPTDPNVLYAGAPSGGVWKSTNGGASWVSVGDGLSSLNISDVAVDPRDPSIVYAATSSGNGYGTPAGGVFKSVDGGVSWSAFAALEVVGNVREMIVRYSGPSQVVIYAASSRGVLRYASSDPRAVKSSAGDWVLIKAGEPMDIAAHPADPKLLYASLIRRGSQGYRFDGLWRTTVGTTASGEADWQQLGAGLPGPTGRRVLMLDIWSANPSVLFAAVTNPSGAGGARDPVLGLFRSNDGGDSWSLLGSYVQADVSDSMYNPFVRVHPKRALVYFGGVKLYKRLFGDLYSGTRQVVGVHDDMKEMEFDPFDPDSYYITSDGGIWRCQSQAIGADLCTHRNNDLRVTQFFDIDASRTDPYLLVGGTQDNGTLLYNGVPDWKSIRGGDGNMALIASADNLVLYGQHQFLHDDYGTDRCMKGRQCSWDDWVPAKNGLPFGAPWQASTDGGNNAWITANPNAQGGMHLLAQGNEVHVTYDGGASWQADGPSGVNVKGFVRRALVQPQTGYQVAGTSEGQVWFRTSPAGSWTLLFSHPCLDAGWNCSAPVRSMAFAPTDPRTLYVAFDIGGSRAYTRFWRLVMNPGPPVSWTPSNITDNFPENLGVRAIAGDGHDAGVLHAATHRGGVYRWTGSRPSYERWRPYNMCLPGAVDVRDLVVGADGTLHAATWGRGAWSVETGP